jgi:hypothetical protein
MGGVMEQVYDIIGFGLFGFLALLLYVNLHMEEEKTLGEHIPLMWEEGGWLRTFWNILISNRSKK